MRVPAAAGKVALKYGPLLYNIEAEDQDIGQALDPAAPLTTEWRGDLLGGVTVIHGRFTSGSPLLAIPNFVRDNRIVLPPPLARTLARTEPISLSNTASVHLENNTVQKP